MNGLNPADVFTIAFPSPRKFNNFVVDERLLFGLLSQTRPLWQIYCMLLSLAAPRNPRVLKGIRSRERHQCFMEECCKYFAEPWRGVLNVLAFLHCSVYLHILDKIHRQILLCFKTAIFCCNITSVAFQSFLKPTRLILSVK